MILLQLNELDIFLPKLYMKVWMDPVKERVNIIYGLQITGLSSNIKHTTTLKLIPISIEEEDIFNQLGIIVINLSQPI